jgi:hypothetical protein
VLRGFQATEVRIVVSPEDAPATGPVELGRTSARAATALTRDHWVLEISLVETLDGAARGSYRVDLAWNGIDRGAVEVMKGIELGSGGITLAFDLGGELETSSVYVLTLDRG